MAKKISKSKIDTLVSKNFKERVRNEKDALPQREGFLEGEREAEEERLNWYPENHLSEAENSKKVNFFARLFKPKPKVPQVSPIQSGSTDILDIIAPSSADLYHRDYIVVDGMYFAYLYLTGYGYSTTVGNGWLNPLVEAGEGINLNFTIKRQPKDKTLSKISQATMVNRSRMLMSEIQGRIMRNLTVRLMRGCT